MKSWPLLIPLVTTAIAIAFRVIPWWKNEARLQRGGTASKVILGLRVLLTWPGEARRVLSELNRYSGPERLRVQFDCLRLSRHSVEDLKWWVRKANLEYRDVLCAAEYTESSDAARLMRELQQRSKS